MAAPLVEATILCQPVVHDGASVNRVRFVPLAGSMENGRRIMVVLGGGELQCV